MKKCAILLALLVFISSVANGQTNLVLDDAFTYFEAETIKTNRKHKGWYLEPSLKMLGDVPRRSAFRIDVKKNGKVVYAHRCMLAGMSKKETQACYDRNKLTKDTGWFDVEVYFVNGDTDEETRVRTYKIDVRKSYKVASEADFYIQRYADIGVGYLEVKSDILYLHTVIATNKGYGKEFGYSPFVRCTLNGTPFRLTKNNASGFEQRQYRVSRGFQGVTVRLPLTLGNKPVYGDDITNKPGKWECRIVGNGNREVARIFRFEVNGDGSIARHPEQVNGNVNLDENTFLIDLEIPKGGSVIDRALLPSANRGLFYGIPWSTTEGKAMAAKMPKKGNPFPTFVKK
ncbi:MAG: hypothetical protein HKN25_03225 [Pyrinomonadaceae bacterium]|nr:hypothetical protein [Pyrinomonadaceae bacterium]